MKISELMANYKKRRVERILLIPTNSFIRKPWARRLFCILAVTSSYLFLANLLLPIRFFFKTGPVNLDLGEPLWWTLTIYKGYLSQLTPVIMVISLLVLRRSMQMVTSVPDELLDERQLINRDWAFRTGYLVIRRVGLAITLAGVMVLVLGRFSTPIGDSQASPNGPFYKWQLAVESYLEQITEGHTLIFYTAVIGILTYVAYSFPIILLAWREAKFKDLVPEPLVVPELCEVSRFASSYFRRISILLVVIITYLWIGIVPYSVWGFFITFLLFGAVGYGVYLFAWASIKTVEILRANRVSSVPRTLSLVFFSITQFLAIALVVSFFAWGQLGNGGCFSPLCNPLLRSIGIGLLMIPMQTISIICLRRISDSKGNGESLGPTE